VGIGYSIHAGLAVLADGTAEADRRIETALTNDPGMGIARHADAGYPEAIRTAKTRGVKIMGLEYPELINPPATTSSTFLQNPPNDRKPKPFA
jgi:urocanate hydratase